MKRDTPRYVHHFAPVRVRIVPSPTALEAADTAIFPLTNNLAASLPRTSAYKRALDHIQRSVKSAGDFHGKPLELALYPSWDNLPWAKLLLVGIGKPKEFTRSGMVRIGAAVARRAAKGGSKRIAISLPLDAIGSLPWTDQVSDFVQGIVLGSYQFEQFKFSTRQKDNAVREVLLHVDRNNLSDARQAVQRGLHIAAAANHARDIANQPGNVFYPQRMAEEAIALGREFGLRVTVWNRARLEREGFGGILAVGQGSEREPRFIQIEYRPRRGRKQAPVALVGKAITFDSGGISIKPSDKMDEMKFDKCGGVAVLGAMRAVASLRLPLPVVGFIAAAENMPGASSYRPGDIVTTYSGTTVEVLNTDAEGRIVLGDALAYARKFKPQAMIDFATLTGACVIALGPFAAGLFSNNDGLTKQIRDAAEATGERVWPFPLWDEYHKKIKSHVADVKNTGGREGGAITAAAFLQKFVGDTPWAHLDIAGTAWATEDKPDMPKGGTGYGVRLLAEVLSNWRPL